MSQRLFFGPLSVLLTALLLVACEPMGPLPGTSLAGELATPPATWETLNEVDVIQLETVGPRSVNIWGVGLASGYYVAASEGLKATWASRLAKDPKTRIRINNKLYELRAVIVTDPDELALVARAFQQKYNLDAQEDFPDATLFRLDAR